MKKVLLCAALIGCASSAWATEYGKVLSVTPVLQRSTVMQPSCVNPNGTAVPGCESQPVQQSTVVGYEIKYLYKGNTYTAQIPNDPGRTVALRFDPNTGQPIPALTDSDPPPPETVVAAPPPPPPAYVYGSPYYYGPAYYGPPVVVGPPVIGIGVGVGFGWHGGGWGWRR
jgi:hypothetical protein